MSDDASSIKKCEVRGKYNVKQKTEEEKRAARTLSNQKYYQKKKSTGLIEENIMLREENEYLKLEIEKLKAVIINEALAKSLNIKKSNVTSTTSKPNVDKVKISAAIKKSWEKEAQKDSDKIAAETANFIKKNNVFVCESSEDEFEIYLQKMKEDENPKTNVSTIPIKKIEPAIEWSSEDVI